MKTNVHNVPTERVAALCNPFQSFTWAGMEAPVTREEIALALEASEGDPTPPDKAVRTRADHIATIAYFVRRGVTPMC